jgi:2,4-dienoyl-CoA reductase-like NADH-dependent reductase (Old Yellow Enzyme family)
MKTNMNLAAEQARRYYGRRAEGGPALVIVEATPLDEFMEPAFPAGLRALADAIHAGGAVAAIQLFHPGRADGERIEPSETDDARAAHTREVAAIPQQFVEAAATAREAGFDGVEIHGAHGFFLNRFFSPEHNQRDDDYGGSLQGRMRLGLECTRAVRAAAPADFLLLYRHTAAADYPLEDSLAFAPELQRAGVDIIDISPSTSQDGDHADLAAAVKSKVSCPVIAVGGMEDPDAAEAVLKAGKADLLAIGRSLITDPDLPRKVLEGRLNEIKACIKCNEKCFGNLTAGIPITCSQNPDAGNEYRLES